MIPLLDMLNHESEAAQITWSRPSFPNNGDADEFNKLDSNYQPKAILHKRAKKGSQVYKNYGVKSNQSMILKYGFAQMNNLDDSLKIGWGLMDGVGGVSPPEDNELNDIYESGFNSVGETSDEPENTELKKLVGKDKKYFVYESLEKNSLNSWWTESRLALLEQMLADKK
eukprot:15349465-Ditylum_brightwellii.AAC.1